MFRSTSGNLTGGCDSTGEHWNPFNTTHGGLQDPKDKRHVGDLGNVQTDANGVATLDITDDIMSLNGPLSIVGYVTCARREEECLRNFADVRLLFTPVQMTWAKVELLCRLSMATLEREFHVALLVRLCSGFRSCSDEENLFQDCRSFCLLNGLLLLYV